MEQQAEAASNSTTSRRTFSTDSESQSAADLFSPTSDSHSSAAAHMNLKEVVEDVHFRLGISCAGCHSGDPTVEMRHAFVKEWPEKDRDAPLIELTHINFEDFPDDCSFLGGRF
jgi:hypothetical protein